VLLIDDGMRHALDIILVDQKGKLRALDHIRGDLVVDQGKPMSGAHCTGTVRSGGRDDGLEVYGLINLGKFSEYLVAEFGVSSSHIPDVLDQDIELIAGGHPEEPNAVVLLTDENRGRDFVHAVLLGKLFVCYKVVDLKRDSIREVRYLLKQGSCHLAVLTLDLLSKHNDGDRVGDLLEAFGYLLLVLVLEQCHGTPR
jgi:hypothetical protein